MAATGSLQLTVLPVTATTRVTFARMLRALCSASLLVSLGCGGGGGGGGGDDDPGIDAPPSAACLEAETYQDIQNIEDKIFRGSCIFSGCHNGQATAAGRIDLRTGAARDALVDVDSEVNVGFKLVVPGQAKQSYLLLILGHFQPGEADPPTDAPPSSIGTMPQGTGGALLCREKREAIERWIVAGALP